MKHLGIDYGTKKIGLAISDDRGVLAFPYSIIENTKETISVIADLIHQESIKVIVIGESTDLAGNDNLVMKDISRFVENMKKETAIPIHFEKEWMSSIAARAPMYSKGNIANESWSGRENTQKKAAIDDKAAAVILQRFLDRKK